MKQLEFEVLEGLGKEYMPSCKTSASAGLDIKTTQDVELQPEEMILIGTGVKMSECDPSLYLECHLRSSLRFKLGLKYPLLEMAFINSHLLDGYEIDEDGLSQLGTAIIDADYRGEIRLVLYNTSKEVVKLNKGDGVAQLILCENLTQKYASKYCLANVRSGGIGSTDE